MIKNVVEENPVVKRNVVILDWEKEVLCGRPQPNKEVMDGFDKIVPKRGFEMTVDNLSDRFQKLSVDVSREFVEEQARLKIACEAEEGRFLLSSENPLFENGEFIIVPIEFSERYDFFTVLDKEKNLFKRIVAVLKPYPWRMDEVKYDG